jgi:hypothetical protein
MPSKAMMTKNQLPNILAYALKSDDGEKTNKHVNPGLIYFSWRGNSLNLQSLRTIYPVRI